MIKALYNAGFSDPDQKQHYAYSHVEFYAHKRVGGLKLNKEFFDNYKHVMRNQDKWLDQFNVYRRKKNDVYAQALVTLYDDLALGKVATLDEFYIRFNKLLKPKRGKAAKLQKHTNARILGAIELAGEEALDNRTLYKEIHRLAAKLSHTNTTSSETNDLLSELIKEQHPHQLTNKQYDDLHKRLVNKIEIMEKQISALEATLLRMRDKDGKPDKVAFRAYQLYGIIKLEIAVGETVVHDVRDWAKRVPFGVNAMKEPFKLLVKLGALDLIEKGVKSSIKGKASSYKRLV
jgi:Mg2+ and Co2+ transporter CorA